MSDQKHAAEVLAECLQSYGMAGDGFEHDRDCVAAADMLRTILQLEAEREALRAEVEALRAEYIKAAKPEIKRADWSDPRVQLVYEILADSEDIPPEEQHWEGWTARRIVAAIDAARAAATGGKA